MSGHPTPVEKTGLIMVDLTNDFLAPNGAYGRAGQGAAEIAALPERIKPLVDVLRDKGGWIISAQFTLVPAKGGEPIISPHLKELRPFLGKDDFAPGSWGNALVDSLGPAGLVVEKVAYSSFYMTRLEWVLKKCGIERLIVGGIVTNGGVASTVRDAHVRDFDTTVLSDGYAAFSPFAHDTAIEALKPVARVATIETICAELFAQ
jgi:ureidoacrylate peracid hydrolase